MWDCFPGLPGWVTAQVQDNAYAFHSLVGYVINTDNTKKVVGTTAYSLLSTSTVLFCPSRPFLHSKAHDFTASTATGYTSIDKIYESFRRLGRVWALHITELVDTGKFELVTKRSTKGLFIRHPRTPHSTCNRPVNKRPTL